MFSTYIKKPAIFIVVNIKIKIAMRSCLPPLRNTDYKKIKKEPQTANTTNTTKITTTTKQLVLEQI